MLNGFVTPKTDLFSTIYYKKNEFFLHRLDIKFYPIDMRKARIGSGRVL
jgi:hypothetical protein